MADIEMERRQFEAWLNRVAVKKAEWEARIKAMEKPKKAKKK
jgi:hypothetical protein